MAKKRTRKSELAGLLPKYKAGTRFPDMVVSMAQPEGVVDEALRRVLLPHYAKCLDLNKTQAAKVLYTFGEPMGIGINQCQAIMYMGINMGLFQETETVQKRGHVLSAGENERAIRYWLFPREVDPNMEGVGTLNGSKRIYRAAMDTKFFAHKGAPGAGINPKLENWPSGNYLEDDNSWELLRKLLIMIEQYAFGLPEEQARPDILTAAQVDRFQSLISKALINMPESQADSPRAIGLLLLADYKSVDLVALHPELVRLVKDLQVEDIRAHALRLGQEWLHHEQDRADDAWVDEFWSGDDN